MGLDSVELIMEIESYFNIRIPDIKAEQMYTVQDMADTVCLYRQVVPASTSLRDEVYSKVHQYFRSAVPWSEPLTMNSMIAPFLPDGNSEHWQLMQDAITLTLPKPGLFTSRLSRLKNKMIQWWEGQPAYVWESVTAGQFTDAICARNFRTLLNPQSLMSPYDIYIGVIAIVAEKIGVDYYELSPEKSFTDDLGMD